MRTACASSPTSSANHATVAGTPRAEFLAELVSLRRAIVVAGAHGKTTTTGMIAFVLAELGLAGVELAILIFVDIYGQAGQARLAAVPLSIAV